MSCYSVSDPATTPSWSDLPIDLLDFIAERLDSRINVKRFRGACSSWRTYTKPPQENSNFPLFPYPLYNSNITQHAYSFKLCETSIYRLHPSNIELGMAEKLLRVEETESGKVRVQDLFGNSKVSEFPQTTSSKVLNMLNFRLTEISKVYDLKYIETEDSHVSNVLIRRNLNFQKVVLSSNPVSDPYHYAVLAVNYIGMLCYTKFGDEKWTVFKNEDYSGIVPRNFWPCDVVDYKQKFYVVDRKGFLLVFNYFFEIVGKILSPDVSDEHVPGFWEDNHHYLISTREEFAMFDKQTRPLLVFDLENGRCKRLSDPKLF
ncbi:hypothetical protein ACFE04_024312 [Oxalis oulophora]